MAIVTATVKCFGCGFENKENAKICRKCGRDMAIPPAWQPDAAWHLKTLLGDLRRVDACSTSACRPSSPSSPSPTTSATSRWR